ncbi:hypothetical protein TrVE_jg7140 [Triparma verrucosa]|uniref:AB hydrolase-1 domain-containing protein n=1 Tax=Triparma verrucosa TaxID=1606542 RepID=A0A9W7B4S5_9STRA|nr:hypothetical protein TrVE_jg7140 [Triparma verrucosa]
MLITTTIRNACTRACCISLLALATLRLKSIYITPRSTFTHLSIGHKFNPILDHFEPAQNYPPSHTDHRPYRTAYVFIGGFGDPPSSYSPLVTVLKSQASRDSIVLTPATPGWESYDNFKTSRSLTHKSWLRSCLSSLHLANSLSDRVVVVGHSTGALVITRALQIYDDDLVDEIYFTGPNLRANKDDASAKRLLLGRLGSLVKFTLPVIKKKVRKAEDGTIRPCDTLNEDYHKSGFYLKAFPVNAIVEMFKLQEQISSSSLSWGSRVKRVVFFKGESDRSVGDMQEQIDLVESVCWAGKVEFFKVKDAAHNLVFEREESGALDLLVNEILRNEIK